MTLAELLARVTTEMRVFTAVKRLGEWRSEEVECVFGLFVVPGAGRSLLIPTSLL